MKKIECPVIDGIIIEHPRPRCPKCQTAKVEIYGTKRRKDGGFLRYYICEKHKCGLKFKTIEYKEK